MHLTHKYCLYPKSILYALTSDVHCFPKSKKHRKQKPHCFNHSQPSALITHQCSKCALTHLWRCKKKLIHKKIISLMFEHVYQKNWKLPPERASPEFTLPQDKCITIGYCLSESGPSVRLFSVSSRGWINMKFGTDSQVHLWINWNNFNDSLAFQLVITKFTFVQFFALWPSNWNLPTFSFRSTLWFQLVSMLVFQHVTMINILNTEPAELYDDQMQSHAVKVSHILNNLKKYKIYLI